MLKKILSICTLLLLTSVFVFKGFGFPGGNNNSPLDDSSPGAQLKLSRAYYILSTLVSDPSSYHLILSNDYSLGAEAVPPHILTPKPTIIVYQGTLSPDRSNEEIAFVLAHELGHINLHHQETMDTQMYQIQTGPPAGISGTTFSIFHKKMQEQEADLFGLSLYNQAGYDLGFFPYTLNLIKRNSNIHSGSSHFYQKELPSLSMKDAHFSMKDRFDLLVKKMSTPR